MRLRAYKGAVLLSGGLVVCSALAHSDAAAPAELTARRAFERVSGSPVPTPQDALVIELSNKSGKRIRGFVFKVTFIGEDGKVLQTSTESVLCGAKSGPARYLEPGATHKAAALRIPSTKGGQPPKHELLLDLVVFEDNSQWGPAALAASQRFLGFVRGWDAARKESGR